MPSRSRALDALREVAVVCRDDLSASLRSFLGVGALALYLVMNLIAAFSYLALARFIRGQVEGASPHASAAWSKMGSQVWQPLYEKLTGSLEAAQAMADVPLQAVVVFATAATFAPLVNILVAHDVVAGDLATGHIRFLAVRCRRGSLLLGRLASRTLLMAAVVLAVVAGDYLLMTYRGDGLPPGAWRHFFRYALLVVGLLPCWVAVAALASSLVRSTPAALMLGLLLLFGLWLVGFSDTVGFLSPMHYKPWLYSPATWHRGLAAYAGFTLAFGGLAWLRLMTRDL